MASLIIYSIFSVIISLWGVHLSGGSVLPRSEFSPENKPSNNSNFVVSIEEAPWSQDAYLNKICKGEPTCHLVEYAPKEFQTLQHRNCMCDEDCATYGDCCTDSKYYNEIEQKTNYKSFYCSQDKVYMIAKCPETFFGDEMKLKCETFVEVFNGEDRISVTPVTDLRKRLTYSNVYCAYCNTRDNHSDTSISTSSMYRNFVPWETELHCWETGRATVSDTFSSTIAPLSEVPHLGDKAIAEKLAKFDPQTKKITSFYNSKRYECKYFRNPPPNITNSIRYCISSISTCPSTSDRTISNLCQESITSIVVHNETIYRNVHCAACNGKTQNLTNCYSNEVNKISFSTIFSSNGKANGGNACNNSAVNKRFCG